MIAWREGPPSTWSDEARMLSALMCHTSMWPVSVSRPSARPGSTLSEWVIAISFLRLKVSASTPPKAEDDERQSLKKTGEAELHRRPRQVIDLVEARDVAHVVGGIGAQNAGEDQPVVADQQRRPGANDRRRARLRWRMIGRR